jgi:hypothetical protein
LIGIGKPWRAIRTPKWLEELAALVESGSVGRIHFIPAERCVGLRPSLRIDFAFRETAFLRGVAPNSACDGKIHAAKDESYRGDTKREIVPSRRTDGSQGLDRAPARRPRAPRPPNFARFGMIRIGRFSITKTERLRSANLLQTPRGPMCKLRQRGLECGGQGPRAIDPLLQPLPFAAIAEAVPYRRAAPRRPGRAFRLNSNSEPYPAHAPYGRGQLTS